MFRREYPGFTRVGCPIRTSPDQRLLAAPRGLSQQRYVLHRPLVPRHPPCALSSLTFLSALLSACMEVLAARKRSFGPRATTRTHCEIALSVYLTEVTHAARRPGEPEDGHMGQHSRRLFMWEGAGSAGQRAPLRGGDEMWRWAGSNRRPPACKAGALPAELHPRRLRPLAQSGRGSMSGRPVCRLRLRRSSDTPGYARHVGHCGLEPQTSRLSAVRSYHLS